MFMHMGESGAVSKARFWPYISGAMSTDICGSLCVRFAGGGVLLGFGVVSYSVEPGVSAQPCEALWERDGCL